MNKIPTVFVRDATDRRYVTGQVNPGCEWVLAGEGVPTRKYDGTCVMFDGKRWWARREVKPGKSAPSGYVPLSTDEVTGKTVGWEPIEQSAFAKYHAEALTHWHDRYEMTPISTYELVGPKINGNPEWADVHCLVLHAGAMQLLDAPRDFDGLARWLRDHRYEGIVFHHPDGRMAKIKRRDFPSEAS